MNDCIFCKIINGEIPSSKVYEDDNVVAFLDLHPTNPGHTLVVPKVHCDALLDCAPEVLFNMTRTAQKVASAVVKAVGADGFNLGVNNGRAAGQIIFHLHMHIIPRDANDGLRPWGHKDYAAGEMENMAEKIKKELL